MIKIVCINNFRIETIKVLALKIEATSKPEIKATAPCKKRSYTKGLFIVERHVAYLFLSVRY